MSSASLTFSGMKKENKGRKTSLLILYLYECVIVIIITAITLMMSCYNTVTIFCQKTRQLLSPMFISPGVFHLRQRLFQSRVCCRVCVLLLYCLLYIPSSC